MSVLRQLVLKPTVFCYHKCPYCDIRQKFYSEMLRAARSTASDNRPGHMPIEMALRQIKDARALGMRECLFSGGDPLLYPGIERLVSEAAQGGDVFVYMNSVGTGLTHARAEGLLRAGLQAWNLSVDSLDPETYDRIRGVKGAFGHIMKALAVLKDVKRSRPMFASFRINFMTVITRHNFRQLPDLFSFCLENGVASVYLMNVYGDERERAFLLSVPEIAEFRDSIVPRSIDVINASSADPIVKECAVDTLASFYSPDTSDEDYANGIWWNDFESAKRGCTAPDRYALIEADGNVLPCCLVEISHEGVVGNVSTSSLADVWSGRGYSEFRERRIQFCRRCPDAKHRTLAFVPELCRLSDPQ